jgi:hypothetical protein
MSRKVRDLSRETLNLPHMMGLPNRALEPISRSWSFCANDMEIRFCTGSGSGDDLFEIARTLIPQGFG